MPTEEATDDRPGDSRGDNEGTQELRERYDELLQELRVLLPGLQVLLAFLFTVPFAARFNKLDSVGRIAFATSLCSAMVAIIVLITPILVHRIGSRRDRETRMAWAIRLQSAGLTFMSLSLLAGLYCVLRFVFDNTVANAATASALAIILCLWIALPILIDRFDNEAAE
jgi:hypothetical protein